MSQSRLYKNLPRIFLLQFSKLSMCLQFVCGCVRHPPVCSPSWHPTEGPWGWQVFLTHTVESEQSRGGPMCLGLPCCIYTHCWCLQSVEQNKRERYTHTHTQATGRGGKVRERFCDHGESKLVSANGRQECVTGVSESFLGIVQGLIIFK